MGMFHFLRLVSGIEERDERARMGERAGWCVESSTKIVHAIH